MKCGFPSVGWCRCLKKHMNKMEVMGKDVKLNLGAKFNVRRGF